MRLPSLRTLTGRRLIRHGSTLYVRLRRRDRKYLLIRFSTMTYGPVKTSAAQHSEVSV